MAFKVQLVIILIALRLIVHYIIIQNSAKKLNEKDLIVLAPLLDAFIVFIQISLFFTNYISKPKHW